jgi:hypothetical protein
MKALLVGFDAPQSFAHALKYLSSAHIETLETYTPMPPSEHEGGSPLPLLMFIAGMLGFAGFFLLMTYADVQAYPIDIGGRPHFAWPTFIPIAFELGVLCAMGAGFVGYFIICRLPRPYDPIDECEAFARASRDGWFIAIRCEGAEALARARHALEPLDPQSIEEYET